MKRCWGVIGHVVLHENNENKKYNILEGAIAELKTQ